MSLKALDLHTFEFSQLVEVLTALYGQVRTHRLRVDHQPHSNVVASDTSNELDIQQSTMTSLVITFYL